MQEDYFYQLKLSRLSHYLFYSTLSLFWPILEFVWSGLQIMVVLHTMIGPNLVRTRNALNLVSHNIHTIPPLAPAY